MNKEEIKELKDYHKSCIESIDNYYLSDSFYEIHNKVFNELDLLHNKIEKAIEILNNPWSFESGNKEVDEITYQKKREVIEILKDSDVDE